MNWTKTRIELDGATGLAAACSQVSARIAAEMDRA